jgi:hypothetical protein
VSVGSNDGQNTSAIAAMITIISTPATCVAFHAMPERIVPAAVLTVTSLDPLDASVGGPSDTPRWSRARPIGDVRHEVKGATTRIGAMSEQSDRLRALRARILSAKEFL